MLEKTLESPLDCKEIKPVHSKGNQSWIFIRRTDAEAETPILWLPDAKNWLIGKDPDSGKDWRQEEKGMTEGEMVGWHYWLNGHEFEQAPRVGEGQGSLACCSLRGHKELNTTERLNWTKRGLLQGYMRQALASKRMSPENPRTSSQGCTTELTVTWNNGLAPTWWVPCGLSLSLSVRLPSILCGASSKEGSGLVSVSPFTT